MTTFERRQQLIEILRKQPGLRVPELAQLLNVSQGTIRNDLNALDEGGQVIRVRGGAAVQGDWQQSLSPSFTARSRKHDAAKLAIASQAAVLVQDGDSVLLDASSTVFYLAYYLQNRNGLRVVTNGIEVARALARNPTNTVILLGGTLNIDGSSINGPLSEAFLQDLYIQTAFFSCSGFVPEVGLTEVHLAEAQLKIRMVRAAQQVVALVDSSKFGKVDLTPFARTEQIDHLFTDQGLSQFWIEHLKSEHLTFSICGENNVSTFTNEIAEDHQ